MRILCIPVNYGCDTQTVRLVRGLAATDGEAQVEVFVVDNTERPADAEFNRGVEEAFGRAHVSKPNENLGYFGAARWALSEYLLDRQLPDWVMVSNVDLEIESPGFFAGLEGLGGRDSAVVGPSIWSSRLERSTNPQYERRPSPAKMRRLARVFSNRLTMNLYFLLAYAKYRLQRRKPGRKTSSDSAAGCGTSRDPSPLAPRPVYSVHGSCLLLSKAYFEAGGDLRFPCFLFGEEIYVAETARRLGLGVVYHPGMKVLHGDHATTGLFRTGNLAKWHAESAAFLAGEFFDGEG